MRVASTLLLALVLVTGVGPVPTARAADEGPPDPVQAAHDLGALLDQPGATWDALWKAYWAVKDATAEVRGDPDEVKARKAEALAIYEGLRPRVAKALRRENLSVGAWLMGFFGASLLWGGFAFCIGVARRATKGGRTS